MVPLADPAGRRRGSQGADAWSATRSGWAACLAGAGGHVFQAAPGRFGQHQGEGEAGHGYPGGEQQRAAQPERVVQQREQEDADEGAELADAGGDPVPGGAHA